MEPALEEQYKIYVVPTAPGQEAVAQPIWEGPKGQYIQEYDRLCENSGDLDVTFVVLDSVGFPVCAA